jgi:hypothetical protein
MLIPKQKTVSTKKKYQVVAIVESKRCPIHGAALVSEVLESAVAQLTLSEIRRRKSNHCPFC